MAAQIQLAHADKTGNTWHDGALNYLQQVIVVASSFSSGFVTHRQPSTTPPAGHALSRGFAFL
ncbi:MAG: hypothetical protein LBL84_02485 [Candidatus Nomurabacteria bacterium]|jgi:hypothetical protein|nr:hypothetical protein [Candidatus Nomurabacteria bacterium]